MSSYEEYERSIRVALLSNPEHVCASCGHPLTHHAPAAFGRRCERSDCACPAYAVEVSASPI